MDVEKQKKKNRRLFLKLDAKLDERLKTDVIDNGIATIPCRVTGVDEIISHYSVKGYETLSSEFSEYIESSASFIPGDYPIVLEISGYKFSEEEQKMIRNTIHEDYLYKLGAVQKNNRKAFIVAAAMLVGMLLTGWLTFSLQGLAGSIGEILYIFFWFFADVVVCYFFIDRFENRKNRLLAGRLADMVVTFFPEYDDRPFTDEEAKAVYRELEKMTYSDPE